MKIKIMAVCDRDDLVAYVREESKKMDKMDNGIRWNMPKRWIPLAKKLFSVKDEKKKKNLKIFGMNVEVRKTNQ